MAVIRQMGTLMALGTVMKLEGGRQVSLGTNSEAEGDKTERWREVDGELSKTRKDLKSKNLKTTVLDKDHLIWIITIPNENFMRD